MSDRNAWYTFEGSIVARTAKALYFWGNYWAGPLWFPVSQTTQVEDDPMEPAIVVLRVKSWLCKKQDLHEFTEYTKEEIDARNEL